MANHEVLCAFNIYSRKGGGTSWREMKCLETYHMTFKDQNVFDKQKKSRELINKSKGFKEWKRHTI